MALTRHLLHRRLLLTRHFLHRRHLMRLSNRQRLEWNSKSRRAQPPILFSALNFDISTAAFMASFVIPTTNHKALVWCVHTQSRMRRRWRLQWAACHAYCLLFLCWSLRQRLVLDRKLGSLIRLFRNHGRSFFLQSTNEDLQNFDSSSRTI